MTQDELIIKRFCKEYNVKLEKIDSYNWTQPGYVLNSDGRIEVLNLHDLEIKKIPEHISELSELKILHLVANELTSIKEIGGLTKLENLVIQANKIKNISVVEQFKNLRNFYANFNPIVDVTPLKHLENLEHLEIDTEKVNDLRQICYIPKLVNISLNVEGTTDITFLQDCKKIKSLFIHRPFEKNNLFIEIFNNVQHLELSSLSINDIFLLDTEKLKFFPKLKTLDISFCEIKDIHFLHHLTELEELVLPHNRINDIQTISELIQLKNISLNGNQIEDITPLKNLKHLKSISLSDNPIKDLAPLLDFNMRFVCDENKYSASENEILISGCDQIINPPIEIVQQGDEAIRRYFDKIKKEGFDYIYEAKLILVGEGGSGKTSLQKRLLDEKAKLPKSEERTRGIEVVDFVFEKDKIAHIWDFGGQVVYYPVHRFFITENSVFVLLASTRQNHHNFDYWIPTIYQFGGESPIIIGQTCHDGNTSQWSDLGTDIDNSKFNIVRKSGQFFYHEINLPNDNEGLNTIKKHIIFQIENLHHFGKPVPKSWLTVRNELLKESELYRLH